MERTLPTIPLLDSGSFGTQAGHSSRTHSIPRRPIPSTRAQVLREELGDEYEEGHNYVSHNHVTPWQRISTDDSGQPHTHNQQQKSDENMTGRLRYIGLICAFLVLPLCGITAALLAEVYQNLLPASNVTGAQPCSGLFVDYGASQLTSLSTWISTVATLLAPAFMALLSYPIARSMTRGNQAAPSTKNLPSPYQTSLLIELLGGNLMSLWGSLKYMVSRKRAKTSRLLHISFIGLVCAVLLGVLMQLADFWLHRATHSILYSVSQSLDTAKYGRQLSEYCKTYYATDAGSRYSCSETTRAPGDETNPPCSVKCGNSLFYPTDFAQGYLLANSLPTNNSLVVVNAPTEAGIDKPETVVAILPSGVDSNITWSATTFGVSTHCSYIQKQCTLSTTGSHTWFTCGGDVPPTGYNSSGPIPFSNSNDDSAASLWLHTLYTSPSEVSNSGRIGNPWTFGLGMSIGAKVDDSRTFPDLLIAGDNVGALMMCNTTTYDVEYSVGTESQNTTSTGSSADSVVIQKLTRSNSDIHNTIQGHIPFALTANSEQYLQNAFLSSIFSSNSDEQILRKFEQEYGKVAMSFSAPSLEGANTTNRQNVEQSVVSCVPRAPLWSLVGLVCIYIVLAFVLAGVALLSSSGNKVRSAQAQLSVAGLAAAAFEKQPSISEVGTAERTEDLFEELNPELQEHGLQDGEKQKRYTKRVEFKVNEVGNLSYHVEA